MAGSTSPQSEMSDVILAQADRLFQQWGGREVQSQADAGAWPEALWQALEEAGLTLAATPEDDGGAGLGAGEVARLIRRAAYHALPVPFAETTVASKVVSP